MSAVRFEQKLAKFAFLETFSFPLPGCGEHEAAVAEIGTVFKERFC
jgi:hypothetical protein